MSRVRLPFRPKMKKKLKFKYSKHQSVVATGLGPNSINLFRTNFGFNKNINIKKSMKKKNFNLCFKNYTRGPALNNPKRAYLPFYSLKQSQHDCLVFLKNTLCYRGLRHSSKLPVRGQRSKTNAKTRSKRTATQRKKRASK